MGMFSNVFGSGRHAAAALPMGREATLERAAERLVETHAAYRDMTMHIARADELLQSSSLTSFASTRGHGKLADAPLAHNEARRAWTALRDSADRLNVAQAATFDLLRDAGVDVNSQGLRDARSAIADLASTGSGKAKSAIVFHSHSNRGFMTGAEMNGARASTSQLGRMGAEAGAKIQSLALVIDDALRAAPDTLQPSQLADVAGAWSRAGVLLNRAASEQLIDAVPLADARSSLKVYDETIRSAWLEHPIALRGVDDAAPRVRVPESAAGSAASIAHDALLKRAELAIALASSRAAQYDGGSAAKRVLAQLNPALAPPGDLLDELLAALQASKDARAHAQPQVQMLAEFAAQADALTPPLPSLLDDVDRALRGSTERDSALSVLIAQTHGLRSGADAPRALAATAGGAS